MASITYNLKNTKKTPPGKSVPIYIRLTDGRAVDVEAKTKYNILPNEWSDAKKAPKRLNESYFKKLNSDLSDLKADLLKHYNNADRELINTPWLKRFLHPAGHKDIDTPPDGLLLYFDFYMKLKKGISENSIERYQMIKNKLSKFETEINKKHLIKEVNLEFKDKFEAFSAKHKFSNNTVASDLHFIRIMCRHAGKRGIKISNHLDEIGLPFEDVETTYLTFAELDIIKKTKLSTALANHRDWLIVSCYTGQRVSDFMRFKKSMIRYHDKMPLIEFKQVKGSKELTLPVHKEIIEILQRRGDFPPPVTGEAYNRAVKKVCELAGLDEVIYGAKKMNVGKDAAGKNMFRMVHGMYPKHELIASHVGRRSFASNYYDKIPTSLLIAATGHKTEEMFLRYIRKSSSDRAKELGAHFGY